MSDKNQLLLKFTTKKCLPIILICLIQNELTILKLFIFQCKSVILGVIPY